MDLVKRYEKLWDSSEDTPDVFEFLQGQEVNDVHELLAVLLRDQQYRWLTAHPLRVEDYLAKLPNLPAKVDWPLQLAIGEYQARRHTAQPLSDQEISLRFSDMSETLRSRLAQLSSVEEDASGAATDGEANPTETMFRQAARSPVSYISPAGIGVQDKGRYRIDRILGEGAFGRVYLGFDEELQRQVAIKVPTKARFKKAEDAAAYLAEARTVASLDYPHIVPVYDVGRTQDGSIYVVSKFIAGVTLAESLQSGRMEPRRAVELLATVAMALQHAHQQRLIHRDIKPANILIEVRTKEPFVTDFGLAIREEDYLKHGEMAGTPAYMSPEQARGEGHRLDGRSDIFSLGVIFYEMLTGRKPFRGGSSAEILHAVISSEPRPPRELLTEIPAELERICLKTLSKRASDRYATAADLAADLEQWLKPAATVAGAKAAVQVVPKGLRSFGADDADYFLDLLPGTRNRLGLPESIAFWKDKIERVEGEQKLSVGLIYGPSGCGKSSLVKAGLLPSLAANVAAVYVEATPEDTEKRILRGLRKRFPELPEEMELADTLARLRRGQKHKLVVIVDQLEQWLHTHRPEPDAELVKALRQCDGVRLQAIIMVRDDFAMAAARFMNALDVPIVQDVNFATVDLFEVEHAEKVLIKFGQAFGKLPANAGNLSAEQKHFVHDVAHGLAQEGKVVSVRLSLFAEMVKGKAWIPSTLQEVGGTQGIGSNFLEETFSSPQSNPRYRLHAVASRGVLRSLLPELGTDIKGHMRSRAELLADSGYQNEPNDFADLLRILDGELRLITPTDPEGHESQSRSDSRTQYYQLTHDYLVPSLREWLTRKQKETRRGRAELKLEERAALWSVKPENRHLPSWFEWLRIRWLTEPKQWTEPQRAMMSKATRVYRIQAGLTTALLLVLLLGGVSVSRSRREELNRAEASRLVEGLLQADTLQVGTAIANLQKFRRWAEPQIELAFANAPEGSNAKLHASLALLPTDANQVAYLYQRLLSATPAQVQVIVSVLAPYRSDLIDPLWQIIEQPDSEDHPALLNAAAALAMMDPLGKAWEKSVNTERVVKKLVSDNPLRASVWLVSLEPVRQFLKSDLTTVFRNADEQFSQSQCDLATDILERYTLDDLPTLFELLCDAQPKQFVTLFDEFSAFGDQALVLLQQELDRQEEIDWQDSPLNSRWSAVDPQVIQQFTDAAGYIAERFAFCQTMPLENCVSVTEALRASGYRPTHFRPYHTAAGVRVAAVWTRDARPWKLRNGLTEDEIVEFDEACRAEGLLACDVAGYVAQGEAGGTDLYAGIWVAMASPKDEARIYVGKTTEERQKAYWALSMEGSNGLLAAHSFRASDGKLRHSGVKVNAASSGIWSSEIGLSPIEFARTEYLDKTLLDVSVSDAGMKPTTEQRLEKQLAAAEQTLAQEADQPSARLQRARANFYLGRDEEALADLNVLVEQSDSQAAAFGVRARLYARGGQSAEAASDVASYRALVAAESSLVYLQTLVDIHQGDDASGLQDLEKYVEDHFQDRTGLYMAARVYALAAGVFRDADISKSKVCATRAVDLLKQAVEAGFSDYPAMELEPDLAALRTHRGFMELMSVPEVELRMSAVWRASPRFEAHEIHGVSPDEQSQQCQALMSQGYRPVACSVTAVGSAARSAETLFAASVWHRPMIAEEQKDRLARRQANAAVAMLRMGRPEKLWPLLAFDPDPRVRTWITHLLSPLGCPPAMVAEQLRQEANVSIRRALLLSLGEYSSLPAAEQSELARQVLDWYQSDADAGIRGASEWLLSQWGKQQDLRDVDRSLATGQITTERQWYITKSGQSMVLFPGPSEFVMGSPPFEPDRPEPFRTTEALHHVHIPRSFALATKEITLKQFQEFLRQRPQVKHEYNTRYSPTLDCPQMNVSWYDAARYCRWLSESEEIDESEMCYPPIEKIRDGMVLPKDYLTRTGYRLPTEAEWEMACRAGTVTVRYCGPSEKLLKRYACYKPFGDRTQPVASLKPNECGLFDTLGNAYEWCHGMHAAYLIGETSQDVEHDLTVTNSDARVLRGGSFSDNISNVRAADRRPRRTDDRNNIYGFRIARTYRPD